MEAMISAIMQANEDEIEKILRAAIRRKREMYPDWEKKAILSTSKEDMPAIICCRAVLPLSAQSPVYLPPQLRCALKGSHIPCGKRKPGDTASVRRDHSVSLCLFISASIRSQTKRFRLLP